MSSYNIRMIFAGLALIFASTVWGQPDLANLSVVRLLENDDIVKLDQVPRDAEGMAFPPGAKTLIKLGLPAEAAADRGAEAGDLFLLGKPAAERPTFEVFDPILVAVDPTREAPFLIVIEGPPNLLSLIIRTPNGDLDPSSISGFGSAQLPEELENPQGVTFDGRNVFVIDNRVDGPVMIACRIGALRAGPAFKRAVEKAKCDVRPLDAVVDGGRPRGIAFNPQNGHLYLFNPGTEEIIELTTNGTVVDRREVQDFDMTDLKGVSFAPSSDGTDAEENFNLFVVTGGTDDGEHTEWTLGRVTQAESKPRNLNKR